MECRRCGNQLTTKVNFCPICGEPISDEEWAAAERAAEEQETAKRVKAQREAAARAEAERRAAEERVRAQKEAEHRAAEERARAQKEAEHRAAEERARAHREAVQRAAAQQAAVNRSKMTQNSLNGTGRNKNLIWAAVTAILAIFVLILAIRYFRQLGDNKVTGDSGTVNTGTVDGTGNSTSTGISFGDSQTETTQSASGGDVTGVNPTTLPPITARDDTSSQETGSLEGISGVAEEEAASQAEAAAESAQPAAELTPPAQEMISVIGGIQAPASDFVFPYSSTQLLTESDLAYLRGLDAREYHFTTQLAINEIYARYGYTFNGISETSKDAIAHFADKDWYKEAQKINPTNDNSVLLSNYFNATEKQNVKTLLDMQKSDHYNDSADASSGRSGSSSGSSPGGLSSSGNSSGTITIIGGIEAPASDFVFPYSSTQRLTDSDISYLKNLSERDMHFEAQLAISEIFARYGYTFLKDHAEAQNARDHFENKDWYKKAQAMNPTNDQSELMEKYFNSIENENVQTLLDFQNTYDHYKG